MVNNPLIRFYFSDWRVLAYLKMHRLGYTPEIAEFLKRSRRAIQYTLTKLENLNLVERHGNIRCPFQWFSLNTLEKEKIYRLIRYLGDIFSTERLKEGSFFVLDFQVFDVRKRRLYKDQDRPGGSLPYGDYKLFKSFYAFLRKYAPAFKSPNLPEVFFIKKGVQTYHAVVEFRGISKINRKFFWIQEGG